MIRRLVCPTLALILLSPALSAQAAPKTGAEVFQRMHDAYAGKWYHTLRFVQKTTQFRPDGSKVISTWYESLRHTSAGVQLRIDTGDPSVGNGVLFTADSTWSVRGGKLAGAQAGGNEFLPLIEGVYVQPVSRTLKELESTKVDMSKVATATWQGEPVWVIGVSSPNDTTAPQIWIEQKRLVMVRMLLSVAPSLPPFDVHLDDYVPVGQGWLATKISMTSAGAPRQYEDYADWKVDIDLPATLFDPATWSSGPHWGIR
jgi:hypothetical protein